MGRGGRDMKTWNGWSHTRVVDKIGKDTSGARDPRPTPDHPAYGSSASKINPHNFWL